LWVIESRYSGDGKYGPATSNTIPVTVSAEKSQTFVGSVGGGTFATGPISVGYGLSWPVGIIVAGNSGYGYPSGQITMMADGSPIVTGGVYDYVNGVYFPSTMTLNYGEKGVTKAGLPTSQSSTIPYVLPTQALGAGSHQLVASYPGDPSFGPSQGSYTYTVTQAQGAILDFFPVGDLVANAPVQFAAQVGFTNGGFAPYGGIITISDITSGNPVVLGKSAVDSTKYNGYWTTNVKVTTPGTHTLRLDYAGDSNVKGVSQTYYVPFTATDPSNVSLSTDITSSYGGQPVTLTAMVSSGLPLHVATGTITFFNGTIAIGSAKVPASGTVVFVTRKVAVGTNSLTASYSGDSVLTSSVSAPVLETVADYSLQLVPAIITVKEGHSGSITMDLVPQGGFANPVQLACSNLPTDVTCSFSKSTVNLDGLNPATVSLTLTAERSGKFSYKPTTVTVTGTSVAGTTPKTSLLELTITK
jgi:hypothetical protein